MPRFVWVVEAVDRRRRAASEPCVIGEAVVDATSADLWPEVIAYRLHGLLAWQTTAGENRGPVLGSPALTINGGRIA